MTAELRKPRGRALSRRRVKALITPGQRWVNGDGSIWTICSIHRKDGLVSMEGPAARPRYVSFGELGRNYRLEDR